MYDASSIDDSMMPLFSLKFLSQPEDAVVNVPPLAVLYPHVSVVADVKEDNRTPKI